MLFIVFALLRKKAQQEEGTLSYQSTFPFRCITYAGTAQEAKSGICLIKFRLQTQIHLQVRHLEVWCNTNMTGEDTSQKVPSALSAISISSVLTLQV